MKKQKPSQLNLKNTPNVLVLKDSARISNPLPDYLLWNGDVEALLAKLPEEPIFDLVVTSPPYNLGKPYEVTLELEEYRAWQERIIEKVIKRLKPNGSLCWQVGNYTSPRKGSTRTHIYPLDYLFHPIFEKFDLILRNRIVWHFGHGYHAKHRFSGRYEVVLWYTLSDQYTFNLDSVRVESKYPGKRHYRGPKKGQYSSNPKGKNPEDVWNIPNVKSYHVEKTSHPCQFPVGLIERLVLALTNKNDLIFDPFAGVASAGVAAALHERRFWGCDTIAEYIDIGKNRIVDALGGTANYRPHNKPIFDHKKSRLSQRPPEIILDECNNLQS